jgi:hypothetical protein
LRLIKLAFISAIFLFLIATGFSLFIPSHIRISKAINIPGRADSVLELVKDTSRWVQWHPAYMSRDSAQFPSIQITTLKTTEDEVVMELQQGNKKPVVNGWKIHGNAGADSLTLQWYMDFHLKWYPWQKFGSLFYENTYGVMMQQGLDNIKSRVEK